MRCPGLLASTRRDICGKRLLESVEEGTGPADGGFVTLTFYCPRCKSKVVVRADCDDVEVTDGQLRGPYNSAPVASFP